MSSVGSGPAPAKSQLPPKRQGKALRRDVNPPFAKTRFKNLIYALTAITLFISAFYAYRLTSMQVSRTAAQWGYKPKPSSTSRANKATQSYASDSSSRGYHKPSIEQQINDLASEFGLSASDLANAIGEAIQKKIPSESVTSIVQGAQETGKIMDALKEGLGEQATGAGDASWFVEKVAGLGGFVDGDEPAIGVDT